MVDAFEPLHVHLVLDPECLSEGSTPSGQIGREGQEMTQFQGWTALGNAVHLLTTQNHTPQKEKPHD